MVFYNHFWLSYIYIYFVARIPRFEKNPPHLEKNSAPFSSRGVWVARRARLPLALACFTARPTPMPSGGGASLSARRVFPRRHPVSPLLPQRGRTGGLADRPGGRPHQARGGPPTALSPAGRPEGGKRGRARGPSTRAAGRAVATDPARPDLTPAPGARGPDLEKSARVKVQVRAGVRTDRRAPGAEGERGRRTPTRGCGPVRGHRGPGRESLPPLLTLSSLRAKSGGRHGCGRVHRGVEPLAPPWPVAGCTPLLCRPPQHRSVSTHWVCPVSRA